MLLWSLLSFQLCPTHRTNDLYVGVGNLFWKGPNCILCFAGHEVSGTVTQPCCYRMKSATDNMEMNGCVCVTRKLYLQRLVMSQVWSRDHSLLTPALELNFKQSLVYGCWIYNENHPKETDLKGVKANSSL